MSCGNRTAIYMSKTEAAKQRLTACWQVLRMLIRFCANNESLFVTAEPPFTVPARPKYRIDNPVPSKVSEPRPSLPDSNQNHYASTVLHHYDDMYQNG